MIERLARETKMEWSIHEETNEPYGNGENYFYWVEPFNDQFKLQWANMFTACAPEKTYSLDALIEKINKLEGYRVKHEI